MPRPNFYLMLQAPAELALCLSMFDHWQWHAAVDYDVYHQCIALGVVTCEEAMRYFSPLARSLSPCAARPLPTPGGIPLDHIIRFPRGFVHGRIKDATVSFGDACFTDEEWRVLQRRYAVGPFPDNVEYWVHREATCARIMARHLNEAALWCAQLVSVLKEARWDPDCCDDTRPRRRPRRIRQRRTRAVFTFPNRCMLYFFDLDGCACADCAMLGKGNCKEGRCTAVCARGVSGRPDGAAAQRSRGTDTSGSRARPSDNDAPSRYTDDYVMVSNATDAPSSTVDTTLSRLVHGVRDARVESATVHGEVTEGFIVTGENNTVVCTLHDGLMDIPLALHPVMVYAQRCLEDIEVLVEVKLLEIGFSEALLEELEQLVDGHVAGVGAISDPEPRKAAEWAKAWQEALLSVGYHLPFNRGAIDGFRSVLSDMEVRGYVGETRGDVRVQFKLSEGEYTAALLAGAITREANNALEVHYNQYKLPPSAARQVGLDTSIVGAPRVLPHPTFSLRTATTPYVCPKEYGTVVMLPGQLRPAVSAYLNEAVKPVDWRFCRPDNVEETFVAMLAAMKTDVYSQVWATYSNGRLWLFDTTVRHIANPSNNATAFPGADVTSPLVYLQYWNTFPIYNGKASGPSMWLCKTRLIEETRITAIPKQIYDFLEAAPLWDMFRLQDTGGSFNADKYMALFPSYTNVHVTILNAPGYREYVHSSDQFAHRHMHAEYSILERKGRQGPETRVVWHVAVKVRQVATSGVQLMLSVGIDPASVTEWRSTAANPDPNAPIKYTVYEAYKMTLSLGRMCSAYGNVGIDRSKVSSACTTLPFYIEACTVADLKARCTEWAPLRPSAVYFNASKYSKDRGYINSRTGVGGDSFSTANFIPEFDTSVTTEMLALAALYTDANPAAVQLPLPDLLELVRRQVATDTLAVSPSALAVLVRPQWERARIHVEDRSHVYITCVQPRHVAMYRPHFFCVPRVVSFSGPLADALHLSGKRTRKILYAGLPEFLPNSIVSGQGIFAATDRNLPPRPPEDDELRRVVADSSLSNTEMFYANTIFDQVGLMCAVPPARYYLANAPLRPAIVPRPLPSTLFFYLRINGEYGRGMEFRNNGLTYVIIRNGEYTRADTLRSHGRTVLPYTFSVNTVSVDVRDVDNNPVVGRYTLIVRLGT
ncbi:hypothetical protein GHT06_003863 [Daphnia sinensis]|uniref:Uncharacterized protein n=1 Tax=Daphnia sinensis TaxID=1820382 RepID=A0AAD5PKT2_9CRUS|nr:hypothetical protein GHT06_003863 [Daphnia sinensis]